MLLIVKTLTALLLSGRTRWRGGWTPSGPLCPASPTQLVRCKVLRRITLLWRTYILDIIAQELFLLCRLILHGDSDRVCGLQGRACVVYSAWYFVYTLVWEEYITVNKLFAVAMHEDMLLLCRFDAMIGPVLEPSCPNWAPLAHSWPVENLLMYGS